MVERFESEYLPRLLEEDALDRWRRSSSKQKARGAHPDGDEYLFIDFPLWPTIPFDLHVAWQKIAQDVHLRAKALSGNKVLSLAGVDPHSSLLEARILAEKANTDDAALSAAVKERAYKSIREFQLTLERAGVWSEWDHPYDVSSREYVDSVWWTFNEGIRKARIIRKEKVVPWCHRCRTALSNIDYDWRTAEGPYIIAKFKLEGTQDFLLVSTRHPEVLAATFALAVDPEREYSRVSVPGQGNVILQSCAIEDVMTKAGVQEVEVVDTFLGKEMLGRTYIPPNSPVKALGKWVFKVVTDAGVPQQGTGVLAVAPGLGTREAEIGAAYELPDISPIDGKGVFDSGANTPYEKMRVPILAKTLSMELVEKGAMFWNDLSERPTLTCAHCGKEVVFRRSKEWFLDMDRNRDLILDETEKVRWLPPWSGGAWLYDHFERMGDYIVSRRSAFSIPIPVWECECGRERIFTSLRELKGVQGLEGEVTLATAAKVTLPCECGAKMKHCGRSFHPLLEFGSASWGMLGYPSSKALFERWWPAHMTVGDLSRGRIWFISQLLVGASVMEKAPFETGVSVGPFTPPKETDATIEAAIREYGADPLRWYLVSLGPFWRRRAIRPEGVRQSYRMLNTFHNAAHFVASQCRQRSIEPAPLTEVMRDRMHVMDLWFASKLERMKAECVKAYAEDAPWDALAAVRRFVCLDLSRLYLPWAKKRLREGTDLETVNLTLSILTAAVKEACVMLNPVCPFVTDTIYSHFSPETVTIQMLEFPDARKGFLDETVEREIDLLGEMGRAAKREMAREKRKVRWGVKRIVLILNDEGLLKAVERHKDLLMMLTNSASVELIPFGNVWSEVDLKVMPNTTAISKVYAQWASKIAMMLSNRPAHTVKAGIEAGNYSLGIEGQEVKILPDMVTFTAKLPPGFKEVPLSQGTMYIDFTKDEGQSGAGFAAELRRRIQQMRKEMELDPSDFIEAYLTLDDDLYALMEPHLPQVLAEVGAKKMEIVSEPFGELAIDWPIEGRSVVVGIVPIRVSAVLQEFMRIPTIDYEKALALVEAGYDTVEKLEKSEKSALFKVEGIDRTHARRIRAHFESKQGVAPGAVACPLCGAPAEPGATVCKRCGTSFGEAVGKGVVLEKAPVAGDDAPVQKFPMKPLQAPVQQAVQVPAQPVAIQAPVQQTQPVHAPAVEPKPVFQQAQPPIQPAAVQAPVQQTSLPAPPPPPDGVAPPPKNEWKCPRCGARNQESRIQCLICDTAKPSPEQYRPAQEQPRPADPFAQRQEQSRPAEARCHRCRSPVPAGSVNCPSCGALVDMSQLIPGMTYLIKEPTIDGSMRMFREGVAAGRKGFCVTRKFPQNLQIAYGLPKEIPIIWLSSVGKENAIRPMDLEKLSLSLEQWLASSPQSIIMVEGIEFLITNNSFKTVLKLIQSLKDQVSLSQATLIITVNATTLTAAQLTLLERESDLVRDL